jgi:hypothetical protein
MQTINRSSTKQQYHKHESAPILKCRDRGMLDASQRAYVVTQNLTNSPLSLKQHTTEVAMKSTIFALSLLVAALIVGCQDSTITDPITATASEGTQLSKTQPVHTLSLNAVLREPGNILNSFVEINGAVAYQATVVALDPIPPNPQYAVRLNVTADAVLRPYNSNGPVWSISGSSEDWASIPESGIAFLTRRYQIEGRSDGMLLNLKFRITLSSVELNSMWLELPRVLRAADLD